MKIDAIDDINARLEAFIAELDADERFKVVDELVTRVVTVQPVRTELELPDDGDRIVDAFEEELKKYFGV